MAGFGFGGLAPTAGGLFTGAGAQLTGAFGTASGGVGINPNKEDFNLCQGEAKDASGQLVLPSASISGVACAHWTNTPYGNPPQPPTVPSPHGPVAMVGCSSWDGNGYCWMVAQNITPGQQPAVQGPMKVDHGGVPVLDCCFCADGYRFVTASADGTAKMLNCSDSTVNKIAEHTVQTAQGPKSMPIRFVRAYKDASNRHILATAGWDMTVKFWDMATGQAGWEFGQADIQERIYAFDINYPRCVIGTAANQIHVYDLASQRKVDSFASPLVHQMRTISIFADGMGFAIGSVEGRVGIQYFNDKSKNFAFRCHREQPQAGRNTECLVFPVNSLSFNPKYNTFASAGSDGTFNFWDKDTKQCVKKFEKCNQTISAAAFQQTKDAHTLPLYVYAVSYDWHKGPEFDKAEERHSLYIHACVDSDIRPKPATGARR